MRSCIFTLFVLGCALLLGCGAAQEPSGSPLVDTAQTPGIDGSATNQRKIVHTAELDLIVEDFSAFPDRLEEVVSLHGAFVAKADYSGSSRAPRHGVWTIRVPSIRYADFVAAVKQMGDVTRIHSDAQDISEQYADLEARLRNKRQEETRLLEPLEKCHGRPRRRIGRRARADARAWRDRAGGRAQAADG